MRPRRECKVYFKSDLISAYEMANARISAKIETAYKIIVDEGIKCLNQMTEQYLGLQSNNLAEVPTFQLSQATFALQRPELMSKRPILMEEEQIVHRGCTFNQQDEESEDTCRFPTVEPTQRKSIYESATANKAMVDSATKKLSKSFKKLGIDDRFCIDDDDDEEENEENTNNINIPQFQGKTIMQIVEESNRKIEARLKERQELGEIESDRSYPLTDYSSNDSSNDNNYQEEYRENSFGKTESNLSSQSYKPSSILYSPKKSKSQAKEKKRLYIRQKKIPHWAEDLQKVNEMVISQNQDPSFDPDQIYGRCVVQQLNTNIIFNTDVKFYRGSSAKWNKNLANQFIT